MRRRAVMANAGQQQSGQTWRFDKSYHYNNEAMLENRAPLDAALYFDFETIHGDAMIMFGFYDGDSGWMSQNIGESFREDLHAHVNKNQLWRLMINTGHEFQYNLKIRIHSSNGEIIHEDSDYLIFDYSPM